MATRFEDVAESRPRIRRDVLFTQTPTGVVFHNAHGGFNLNGRTAYRFASLLVPHLTGTRRVEELCAGLGEQQRVMVAELVRALYGRGFARDVAPGSDGLDQVPPDVARRFAAQLDYIDHYAGESGSRFLRFRGTRVAVLGDDAVARWCALSLVRNGSSALALPRAPRGEDPFAEAIEAARAAADDGCPVEIVRLAPTEGTDGGGGYGNPWDELAGYGIVVATGGPRDQLRLLGSGVPGGSRLLPAWTFGDRAVVGPVMAAGQPGCWACAALRLGANGDPAAAAGLWQGAALDAPGTPWARPVRGPLAAMLGNLLGYEVFRLATGAPAAETEGQVIVQDLDALDVVTEPLLPHPQCPYCGAAEEPATAQPLLSAAEFAPGPTAGQQAAVTDAADEGEGGDGSGSGAGDAPDEDTADAVLAELDARGALVHPHAGVFSAFADDTWQQTPLKAGTVRVAVGPGGVREISAFDVHHVAGARLRALYRAATVYTERVAPLRGTLSGRALAAAREKWPLIAPATVDTASGTAADDAATLVLVPAASLLTGRTALLPAAAVRTFGADNHDRAFVPTAAGSGAGPTAARATADALLSALAFHAVGQAMRGRGGVSVLPLPTDGGGSEAEDRELVFLARSADNLGLAAELLDLGGDLRPAPVVLARALDPASGRTRWAVAAAPSRRAAAVAALRDLLGQVQLDADTGPGAPADTGDPLVGDFDAATLTSTGVAPALTGAGRNDRVDVLTRLGAAGLDAFVVATGSADLRSAGVHVARVVLVHGTVDAL